MASAVDNSDLALQVLSKDGSLVTSEGKPLLLGLPALASTAAAADGLSSIMAVRSSAGAASLFDTPVGKLACKRFLALARISIWWMSPAWGTRAEEIPGETQFLLLELGDGTYGLLLPLICSGKFRGTLRASKSGAGELVLRMESGDPTVMTEECSSALLVAAGKDPFELVQRGVTLAAKLSGTAKHRSAKVVPPSVDYFGWCTWDACYSRVSAQDLQKGLKALVDGGAPPKVLIIDDGWQQTDVDPEFRAVGSSGCIAGGFGMGGHLEAAKEVEEAAAELLSGPDNHMDQALHAAHEIQAEEEESALVHEKGKPSDPPPSPVNLLSTLRDWVLSACGTVRSWVGHLEASFLLACKRLMDGAPAGSLRMRLISALATGPLRGMILRFYAQASDHTRRLVSIEANAKFSRPSSGPEFPLNSCGGDLSKVVAHVKHASGVKYVFAWHAMTGFWGGLSAGEREMQKYKARLVLPEPSPSLLELDPTIAWTQSVLSGVSIPASAAALHNDMHAYLAGCGIDGIKVDVQSTVGLVGSRAGGGPALSAEYHASLEASTAKHFPGNTLLNCMCHSTEDLYRMENSNLARASDDFWPLLPPSHTAHIVNCASNSLFMGEIVIPDWDMFHSLHDKALLHAAARAVSGGPVYVSDRVGRHDFGILRRLVLPDGSVLRCQQPGRPTADCLFADVARDGKTVLKVWNINACTGVVGVFNVQGSAYCRQRRAFHTHDPHPPALVTSVSPADIPALKGAAQLYAAYSDNSRELTLLRREECLELTVAGGGGCDVVTVSPVLEAGGIQVAPIGLVGMLNAGGAVLSCALTGGEDEGSDGAAVGAPFELLPARCTLGIKGCGSFLCFASQEPSAVLLDGQQSLFEYNKSKGTLTFEVPAGEPMQTQCQICF